MDEAVKRYGEVLHRDTVEGEEIYGFIKNGFLIIAHFREGKIDVISYAKGPDGKQKLTPSEINTFLKVNNNGRLRKKEGSNAWSGKNGTVAGFAQEDGMWILAIVQPDNKTTETDKEDEKKALEAF